MQDPSKRLTRIFVGFFCTLLMLPAVAVEEMSANTLRGSCTRMLNESGDVYGEVCKAYLQGFVSGSTKVSVAAPRSEFMERALRTRAPGGSTDIDTLKMSRYCLPEGLGTEVLAQQIIDSEQNARDADASSLLEAVLKAHYPCKNL